MDGCLRSDVRFQSVAQERVTVHRSEDHRLWVFGDSLHRRTSPFSTPCLVSYIWILVCFDGVGVSNGRKERSHYSSSNHHPPAERHYLVPDAPPLGGDVDHVLSIESLREKYLIDREDRYNALLRGNRIPDR